MNNLHSILQARFNQLETAKPKRNYVTTEHQVKGLMYAKKLNAKKGQVGFLIKLCKETPAVVDRAYSYVSDYPNARNLFALFCWKYWDIRKSAPPK